MSARGPNPNAPRAMFAGDAERDLQRLRDAGDPRVQRAPTQHRPRDLARAQQQGPAPQQRPATPEARAAALGDLRGRIAALEARESQGRAEGPDPGNVIADIPRGDGTVTRVAVKRWRPTDDPQGAGRAFVDVRVWSGAWPVKGKGLSVRPRELAALAAALLDAADAIARDRGTP